MRINWPSEMLVNGKPDVVICFPGGKGTDDMRKRAVRALIRLIVVDESDE